MSSQNPNIYSQGLNFGGHVQHGVDNRTGQYNCSIPLYEAPSEALNCPAFKLSLNYNALGTRDIGFGQGWEFNLSRYNHRQSRTLHLMTGEQYQIYDLNDSVVVRDQKLKSFQFDKKGSYYHVIYKSGQQEMLSNVNNIYNMSVPVEIIAPNGRSLRLSWTSVGSVPRLHKVSDGSQDLVAIEYSSGLAKVTCSPGTPESATFVFTQLDKKLSKLALPSNGGTWSFKYQKTKNYNLLTQVSSPAGLLEVMTYDAEGHKLPQRAPMPAMPHILSHTIYPGKKQPPTKTLYKFSSHNFLGYGGPSQWSDGEDNLYRSPASYNYTSTVRVEGGATTIYKYNKYHLLVSTHSQHDTKCVTEEIIYHCIEGSDFKNQPAQYQLPKTKKTTFEDLATTGAVRSETTSYSFDIWGNSTEVVEPDGIKTTRIYFSATGEQGACPADPNDFVRYLRTEVKTPKTGGSSRSKQFKYTRLPCVTSSSALVNTDDENYFVAVKEQLSLVDEQHLTKKEYLYVNQPTSVDHGRIREHVETLNGQYPNTQILEYEHIDPGRLKTTVKTTSFDGITVRSENICVKSTGATVSQTDEHGHRTEIKHDLMGRLVEETTNAGTSYEATKKQEYAFCSDGQGYELTQTDAQGYKTRITTDAMERVIEVAKQEDDDAAALRVVEEMKYNAIGQCIQVDSIDWIASTKTEVRASRKMEFDHWGQPCKIYDGSGPAHISSTNPITRTQTTGIEGESMTESQIDASGEVAHIRILHSDGTVYGQKKVELDGWGCPVCQTDTEGQRTEYKVDNFDRVIETSWPDDATQPSASSIQVEYAAQSTSPLKTAITCDHNTLGKRSYDGLARLKSHRVGERMTNFEYEGNVPQPASLTNANAYKHSLNYASELDFSLLKLQSSDFTDSFQHDGKTGAVVQAKNNHSTLQRHYLPSGKLASEKVELPGNIHLETKSTYSLLGNLLSHVDVHGQNYNLEYDSFGRPTELVQGRLQVSFVYSESNRLSRTCTKDSTLDESKCLTTDFKYDEFGRETRRVIFQGEKVLYDIQQTFGKTSKVTKRRTENAKHDVLRQESFAYDSRHRLILYTCQGSQSPVDENGWRIQEQKFCYDALDNLTEVTTTSSGGEVNTTSYLFSKTDPTQLVQIKQSHPDFSATVDLEYDKQGSLTRDELGQFLEYDTRGRLMAVRNSSGKELCRYQYDPMSKLVCQQVEGQPDTHLHYREGVLLGVTSGESKTSFLSDGVTYWGQTLRDSKGEEDVQLWASDYSDSILASAQLNKAEEVSEQQYTPWGFSADTVCSIGFNGKWRDPVTGWYHLGDGYRVYNPVLRRFHSPDSWCPFDTGEINPYAYCLGDPVNRSDPSGQSSSNGTFGTTSIGRDILVGAIGILTGIAAGVLTGGASLAVEVGLAIAVGAGSDAASGIVYDALLEGKAPTWGSVAVDAAWGAVGAGAGFLAGRALEKGLKTLSKTTTKGLVQETTQTVRPQNVSTLAVVAGHFPDGIPMTYLEKVAGNPNWRGILTHGKPGYAVGWNPATTQFEWMNPSQFVKSIRRSFPQLFEQRSEYDKLFLFVCNAGTGLRKSFAQGVADRLGKPVIANAGGVMKAYNKPFKNAQKVHAIDTPIKGYGVVIPEWEVEVMTGDTTVLQGTIEEVHAKLLQLNPNWDEEYINSTRNTADAEERYFNMHLFGQNDFKGAKYECNEHWPECEPAPIATSIDYMRTIQGKPMNGPGPGTCGRVSCSQNAAIWWCNDVSHTPQTIGSD
ncbi:hypothetical protein ACHAPO_012081 [Fusarium lateritium]